MKKAIILGLSLATLALYSCSNEPKTPGEKLDHAIEETKEAGHELKQDAQKAANNVEAGAQQMGQDIKEGTQNAVQETKDAANKTGEAIKDGANKAAAETKAAVNKTGEAIKDGAKEVKKDIHNATR